MLSDNSITGNRLVRNQPLSGFTSLGIGGWAKHFCEPATTGELVEAVSHARVNDLPLVWFGGGSNILIHDNGISGLVLRLRRRFSNLVVEKDLVVAEAGLSLSRLANLTCKDGLLDLSFCAGIPGTCGGAVYMNAGTKNGEISEKVAWVELIDPATGRLEIRTSEEMGFAYRASILQQEPHIVSRVALCREEGDGKLWCEKMRAQMAERNKVQPRVAQTAGSFFRNPPGEIAGILIERAGLKGTRIGDALVSPVHGNFLVNVGHASSDHFVRLIKLIRKRVFEQSGVLLDLEVCLLGFSEDEKAELGQD